MSATRYNAKEHPKVAYKVMLLGATLAELAKFLEVGTTTVDRWIAAHPEFADAVKRGGVVADMNVAKSLYRRATGFRRRHVKIFQHQGEAVIVPYTEYYPPSEVAAFFWLKNRQKDKWRDKLQLSGDPESPVSITLNMGGAEAAKKGGK